MGLAMWHTAHRYEDIKYLASKANSALWTALTNVDNQYCNGKDNCHGKLVWQQVENGAEEYFETHTAYNSIKATTSTNNYYSSQKFETNGEVEGWDYRETLKVACGGKDRITIFCNRYLLLKFAKSPI